MNDKQFIKLRKPFTMWHRRDQSWQAALARTTNRNHIVALVRAMAAGDPIPTDTQLVRDALLAWFSARGGSLGASMFYDPGELRWNLPAEVPDSCTYNPM